MTAVPDGFVALQLARDAGQEQAPPRVERETHLSTLPGAYAFARSACAKHGCVGLIFMPATDSPVSVLDAAVAAASSHGAAPLVLELREPESGGESNDLMNSGRLSAEVIQHVVRGLAATFRHCYERGLARNSALEGLVATRFVIDRAGEVRESAASSAPPCLLLGATQPLLIRCC